MEEHVRSGVFTQLLHLLISQERQPVATHFFTSSSVFCVSCWYTESARFSFNQLDFIFFFPSSSSFSFFLRYLTLLYIWCSFRKAAEVTCVQKGIRLNMLETSINQQMIVVTHAAPCTSILCSVVTGQDLWDCFGSFQRFVFGDRDTACSKLVGLPLWWILWQTVSEDVMVALLPSAWDMLGQIFSIFFFFFKPDIG